MSEEQDNLSQILSQSDIDALMAESSSSSTTRIVGRRDQNASEAPTVELFDFRNPVYLNENEMRRIRILHEKFIHYLSARLSLILKAHVEMNMAKLMTMEYSKFVDTVQSPSYLVLFQLEQLQGNCILDLNPRLAMTIIDRMLGGRGHSVKEERFLTEIEGSLIEDFAYLVLEGWCRQWEDICELNPTIVDQETNARFLLAAPGDAIVLVVSIETTLGDCSESIQIAVPYFTIEPIVKSISRSQKERIPRQQEYTTSTDRSRWNEVVVDLFAEIEVGHIPSDGVVELRIGDLLIGNSSQNCVKVNGIVGDESLFNGEYGVVGGLKSIKVVE